MLKYKNIALLFTQSCSQQDDLYGRHAGGIRIDGLKMNDSLYNRNHILFLVNLYTYYPLMNVDVLLHLRRIQTCIYNYTYTYTKIALSE